MILFHCNYSNVTRALIQLSKHMFIQGGFLIGAESV